MLVATMMISERSTEVWVQLTRKVAFMLFILTCFDSLITWVECASKADIEQHLSMGMRQLAKGHYSDALSHFHAAVDADPDNYMSYYKRATVFMALGRSRQALADFDRVIELKSDFVQARVQRAMLLVKMGRLDEAHIEVERVLANDPSNDEASRLYIQIEPLKKSVNEITDFIHNRNYQAALASLSEVIEKIPWDPWLREIRADAYLGVGNKVHAILEMRALTKLSSADNTDNFFKLASLHYQLGDAEHSLNEVRECLKLDPEHKNCYLFYKKAKKMAKFVTAAQDAQKSEDWAECVSSAEKILKNEPEIQNIRFHGFDSLCQCGLNGGLNVSLARRNCFEAIRINEEPRLLCDRAETYLAEDMYDEAVKDYQRALELDEHFRRAKDGLHRAQMRQKMSKKRDYYKILGVSRRATKKEVMKAYRKLAQKWHPDNFQNEQEKKVAETKFMDIAAAKEVLSDKEMREQFDNGEDPLDPESQKQHQHGDPFHHFHRHPFGGDGPYQFKFHFN